MAVACSLARVAQRLHIKCLWPVLLLLPSLPAAEDARYILGPEDQIVILAVEPQEIVNKPVRIASNGMVNLPLVGPVKAGGLTVEQFEAELQKRLTPFVNRPQVSVNVLELRSRRVSVLGAVNKPGVYQLYGNLTLMELLSQAGGLRSDAGTKARITRMGSGTAGAQDGKASEPAGAAIIEVPLKETAEWGSPEANPQVFPNDIILVTRAETVYVVGEVVKPGGFVLNDRENLSVLKALSLAGGLDKTAAPGSSRIIRVAAGSNVRTEIRVDLKRVLTGKSPDISMLPEDILFVPRSAGKRVAFRSMEAVMQTVTGIAIYRR